ncbi:Protein cwh43 [Malassezia caprae]|uniref:Protein cwh43 n=1 Tax=Malassezia caprae TaxID=1381934 RepID=A0AAF0E858_9BASI|nr:Protein cwh43 [Malassezia caprae]
MGNDAAHGRCTVQPVHLTCTGAIFSIAHTVLGYTSFFVALTLCLSLHYRRVVKNHVAGYPDEWWPSVSATVGDWFPERNVFQIMCAATSGFRFVMVALLGALTFHYGRPLGGASLVMAGLLRTIACGGWIFITSSDHALTHDVAMGAYLALTPVWMALCLSQLRPPPGSPLCDAHRRAQSLRAMSATLFYACTPLMVYFYLAHRRDRIPGMYTYYSLLEWSLVFFDMLFDAASAQDLQALAIQVLDAPPAVVPAVAPAARAPARPSAARVWGWVMSQTFLAWTAWSALFALISMIFYFSVSNMAAEGLELLVVAQALGLAITACSPLQRCFQSSTPHSIRHVQPWRAGALWVLSLATVASYALSDAVARLVINALSCAVLAVLSAVDWSHAWEAARISETATIWLVGLIAAVVSRYANHANIPIWAYLDASNGGRHISALALAALCVVPMFVPSLCELPDVHVRRMPTSIPHAWCRFIIAAGAMGVWLCEVQTFLSDAGTVISYGWTGYPVRGPMAISHGVWVITAMALGTAISLMAPRTGASYGAMALHAAGMTLLLRLDNWASFAGGLLVAVTLPWMFAPLLQSAQAHHPLRVMSAAWFVMSLLAFLGVLTTAYAFLPGAYFMREHTVALTLVQTLVLFAGVVAARTAPEAQRLVPGHDARARTVRCALHTLLALLVVVASLVPAWRHVDARTIQPHHPGDRIVTAGIWTVHFGFDQHMRDSSRRMSSVLKDLELDIVGLLETDLHRPAFGNRDLTQWLAQELQIYADLGPSPKKHTWGAVLLSKFPIINSTHHLLPSPHGELAPAIHAVLDIYGVPTHVIVSHNGQEEDPLDRELQTTELARLLREAYPHPAIFLGYVVTKPHAPRPNPYDILFRDGRLHDVDATDMDRWCQYLGFRGLHRLGYARVSRYTVTDTELQTFKLQMPAEASERDPDHDLRPRLLPAGMMPVADWAYPLSFVKPGRRVNETHRYAPYALPRYYGLPEAPAPEPAP